MAAAAEGELQVSATASATASISATLAEEIEISGITVATNVVSAAAVAKETI